MADGQSVPSIVQDEDIEETVNDPHRNSWSELCKRHKILKRTWRNREPFPVKKRSKPKSWSRKFDLNLIAYHMQPEIKHFRCFQFDDSFDSAVIDEDIDRLNITPLSECKDSYYYSLIELLKVEELHQAIEMRRFDQFDKELDCNLATDGSVESFGIYTPGLVNMQPSLIDSDFVILENKAKSLDVALKISSIIGNKIVLPKGHRSEIESPLDISIVSSGQVFAACHQALFRLSEEMRIDQFLFAKPHPCEQLYAKYPRQLSNGGSTVDKERLDQLNERQRQAVEGILRFSSGTRPYILFGPPGTGKTHTLIEAVLQIFHRSNKKVLFCVNSNTCAHQLYKKLKQHIPKSDILHMRAGDSVTVVYKAQRIVVTTNIKSISFVDIEEKFDFVFIDEAAHANVAESLVPICVLDYGGGCLVLAGDPKQLGPVVMCQQAGKLGLNNTLLDRQFEFDTYRRGRKDNQYKKDYVTKLIECYRCDPCILATSNKLFYENELQCRNKTPQSILDTLKLTSPVQFKQVKGKEQRPHYSTSWCNEEEAIICVNVILRLYKNGFKPEQIGVITPYRLQGREISTRLQESLEIDEEFLNKHFNNQDKSMSSGSGPSAKRFKSEKKSNWKCKIGAVDAFQGNEREVIIISTVRTSRDGSRLDFLNDARRFNVAISRAKWLLIIIGDPDVLTLGNYWPHLINNCARDIDTWGNK